jgi:hypothetical protein
MPSPATLVLWMTDLFSNIETQSGNLSRVKAVIAPLILEFCKSRGVGAQFHMVELTEFVSQKTSIAPDSAGRILRDMRQQGELNYKVVQRRESLYQIEA